MILLRRRAELTPRDRHSAPYHSIDEFFTSLVEGQKIAAISVIHSGSGSDGTRGLKAIKTEGSVAFALEAASRASLEGLPRH